MMICAYRYDWQGRVSFSDFARVVRIVGAMATRGYQWFEQVDDAARRYKEEQVQEQGEASADDRAATKPDATESGAATKRANKILH
jgi:exonuclease I